MKRKPWPQIASSQYQTLVVATEGLTRLANQLFGRAVFGIRNTSLLEELLQVMPAEVNRIQQSCRIANQLRKQTPKGYRYPKWAVAALENILSLADKVNDGLEMLAEGYKCGNWDLVEQLTKLIQEDALEMERIIQSGPPPLNCSLPVQDPLDELVEIVQKVWPDDDELEGQR